MTKSNFSTSWYSIQKFSQPKDNSGDNENYKFPIITKYDSELKCPKATNISIRYQSVKKRRKSSHKFSKAPKSTYKLFGGWILESGFTYF